LDINPSTFYNWLKRFYTDGVDALEDKKPSFKAAWNKIPDELMCLLNQVAICPKGFDDVQAMPVAKSQE
jgi:hypothetical protein